MNRPMIYHCYTCTMIEGSLEVKLPTISTVGKAEVGRVREEKKRSEKIRRERERRKKMHLREKVGKSRFSVFQWFVAPEGRKVCSLKRRVRSHVVRWDMRNCTPLWREAHLEVQRLKKPHDLSTFGTWDVEKVHATVARRTFRRQKCTKHHSLGPLLEVEMSKKCAPLWCEARFQVKMYKTPHVRTTFGGWDVEKVHAIVARSLSKSKV